MKRLGIVIAILGCWMLAAHAARQQGATVLDAVVPAGTPAENAAGNRAGDALARMGSAEIIGKPAPAAILKTIDGESIDLGKSYGSSPVYLKFWATWCVPCNQQMPSYERMYESLGRQLKVIAVNVGFSDDEGSVRAMRARYGLKMPIVIDDGTLDALFHVSVTPLHVLIGRNARVDYVGYGDDAQLASAIRKAIDSKPSLSGAISAGGRPAPQVLAPGAMVGHLSVTTTSGRELALKASQPHRLQAVEFVSSWCESYLGKSRPETSAACARARRQIEAIAATDRNVEWLGIAGGPWSSAASLKSYLRDHHVSIPFALDEHGSLFRAFGIRDMPTIAVLDSSGRLLGLISPLETDLAAALGRMKSSLNSQTSAHGTAAGTSPAGI